MRPSRARRARLACAAVALAACASDVQLIRRPETEGVAARPSGCEVKLLPWQARPEPGCVELADVYVGDRGYEMLGCGRPDTERRIREQACLAGADTALVRRLRDFHSKCFQARARLLQCTGGAR